MLESLIEQMYKVTSWVYQIAKLTLFMWISLIVGLVIFGIGPTLMTATQVVLEMMEYRTINAKNYFHLFKRNFIIGNQLYLPLLLALSVIVFGFSVFKSLILSWIYVGLFLYMIQLIFTISTVKQKMALSIKESWFVSIKFSQYNPINTIILVLINFLCINLIFFIPGLILFFSLGFIQTVNTLLMVNFIKYNEKRMENTKCQNG